MKTLNNRWLVLFVVSIGLFLISIDMTVLYTALPQLTHDLAAGNSQKLWIVNAFPLVMAGLLPTMGALGDRIGHRRIFIWGLATFGVASLFAAYAPSANALIAGRTFLAVGASMMMPATLSLLRVTFTTDKDRALAIGIWASVFSGGVAIGPLIGGGLLTSFWWGSVFLINVPVVVLALILTPLFIAPVPGNPTRPFDLINSGLAMVAMVGLVYGLMELARPDASWLEVALSLLTGLAVMIAFVRRQDRSQAPMIDLALFRNGRFTAGAITAMVSTVALVGVQLVFTQRMQLVAGYSPLSAALFMLPISLASFVASPLSGAFLHKVGLRRALWLSLIVAALGLSAYCICRDGNIAAQSTSLALFGLGVGAGAATASIAIMINAPEDKAGMAASIESIAYETGAVLGVAVLGSLLSFAYAAAVVLPDGVPDAARARDSLDQALLLAERLPIEKATILISQAKAAFDIAFVAVLVATIAVLVVMAGVIVRITRPR